MEKEEQKLEQAEVEEEETTHLVRKSRNGDNTKIVSYEVSKSNGHTLQLKPAQNEEIITPAAEEDIIEKREGFLENEPESINVILDSESESKLEESDMGLEIESEAINEELKPENLVFHDKDEGVKSTSTYTVKEQILKGQAPVKFNNSEINNTYEPSKEIENAELDEDDLEITVVDVERVIEKQTTHDLYCPNCKSCITKRVILRKRKRRTRRPDEDVKRNTPPNVSTKEGEVGVDDAQESATDDIESDIFRCLSCFTFFIPTGDGFKLFSWFTDIFAPNKYETSVAQDKTDIQPSPPSPSVTQTSEVDGRLNISQSIPHEEQDVTATIVTKSLIDNKEIVPRSSESSEVYPAEVLFTGTEIEVHPHEPIKTEVSSLLDTPLAEGNSTVITIDRQPPETATATAFLLGTKVSSDDRGEGNIEVIKSIVYGGLAESITSLSVVSSAVGGGAATLNVLALGAANLIGGLFVISHNLWELRHDKDDQVSNQIPEQKDRYREVLGQRQNFVIHSIVAIISYLIFGLVSPVVYGFSFRGTDDKQLKLVVAAAASLMCIITLAVAKAYVQTPPKPYLKTVLSFVVMGFMVSGVSYVAGHLVERLVEKLGLFESTSAVPDLLVQEMIPVGSGWTSY